jgi:hypothetical protein
MGGRLLRGRSPAQTSCQSPVGSRQFIGAYCWQLATGDWRLQSCFRFNRGHPNFDPGIAGKLIASNYMQQRRRSIHHGYSMFPQLRLGTHDRLYGKIRNENDRNRHTKHSAFGTQQVSLTGVAEG